MSNVTGDNLGRRLFQVKKEKAVEDALEKIRHGLGSEWSQVTPEDADLLTETLGEVWTSIDRERWGSYRFSKLSHQNIQSMLTLGKDIRHKQFTTKETLAALDTILSC